MANLVAATTNERVATTIAVAVDTNPAAEVVAIRGTRRSRAADLTSTTTQAATGSTLTMTIQQNISSSSRTRRGRSCRMMTCSERVVGQAYIERA
jgi:hypothetical protein